MGLFSRKPKVTTDYFCEDFYDKHIRNPVVNDTNLNEVYAATVSKAVGEADPAFRQVDPAAFCQELTMVRLEMFALAWLHNVGESTAARQSDFTKDYLTAYGLGAWWDGLEKYNQVIARSTVAKQSPAKINSLNVARADYFDKWAAEGFDHVAVARAANRLGSEGTWKNGLTPGLVMVNLCSAVGLTENLNEEGQDRLIAVVRGFFDGARNALKEVKISS